MRTVLLAHGLFGFSRIGALAYFTGVRECWRKANPTGQITFLAPPVPPTGSLHDRALALKAAIEAAFTRDQLAAGKVVHVVGHSMGGLDARYLMSRNGLGCASWIASLTTISTPHAGSMLADIALGRRIISIPELVRIVRSLPGQTLISILRALGNPVPPGVPVGLFAPQAIVAAVGDIGRYVAQVFGMPPEAIAELTPSFAAQFNQQHPSLEGVPLLSYAGISSPDKTMCRTLFVPWILLNATGNNDGVVPDSSSSLGPLVRRIPADHLEEVGLAGLFDGLPPLPHYDISALYSDIDAWQTQLPN